MADFRTHVTFSGCLGAGYAAAVAAGGLTGVQAVLIAALLLQRAGRRSAEREALGLSGRLLTAHEDERKRLARELHDDLTQRLARLAIDAGKLELGVAASAAEMHKDLVRLSEDLDVRASALISDMDNPLGSAVGNALEVRESIAEVAYYQTLTRLADKHLPHGGKIPKDAAGRVKQVSA